MKVVPVPVPVLMLMEYVSQSVPSSLFQSSDGNNNNFVIRVTTTPCAFLGISMDTTFLDIIWIDPEDNDDNADENFAGSISRDWIESMFVVMVVVE